LVSTSQQRREAERRRLRSQLEERRAREAAHRRFKVIAAVVSTLVVIVAIVVVVVLATGGSSGTKPAASKQSTSASSAASSHSAPSSTAPAATGSPVVGPSVSFRGVTVQKANDLRSEPKVTSKGTADPTALEYKDLVVGSGKAATSSSTVTVQYTGVLYKKGTQFDSSWSRGQPAQFSLAQVVPGFTQGIGGNGKIPPMKAGGRRIMILPAALGYGAQANGSIPANSTLVFVVDLKSVDG
jgi:peptidylprolyl isomerase